MDYLILLLSLVTICVLATSRYNTRLNFSGVIWGIQIPYSPKQKAFMKRNRILLVLSMIAFFALILPTIGALFSLLFESFFLVLVYIVLLIVCVFVCSYAASKKAMHSPLLKEETNASVLGNLPFVQSIEAQMDLAAAFIVSFEGIALINNMNYCYALERYENYRMGSLTSPNEVAMIGMYFVQKYHHTFDFVVDMERIPGTPGQSVTIVGSSGINFAYSKGTPDQQIFRSYIFTRK